MSPYPILFGKLERILRSIESSPDPLTMLETLVQRIVALLRDDLGLIAGRLYELDEDGQYRLVKVVGEGDQPEDFSLSKDYEPVAAVRRHGYVVMNQDDPEFRKDIESKIGVDHFAAICFGDEGRYIVAFTLKQGAPDAVLYALNAVRHVCDLKLRQRQMERSLDQARRIQDSLLDRPIPSLEGYEIAARSRPAEAVGGDFSVFIAQNDRVLGFAIGDVVGHGLPAALQARDVVIGLMMGIHENQKMIAALERLNRVIHETSLASKFVTLFYGEIETNGNLIFVNAGHPPPRILVTGKSEFVPLRQGGMVMGPCGDARYHRGFCGMEPGDIFIAFTDGVVEAESEEGESYAFQRIGDYLKAHREEPADKILDGLFADLDAFSRKAPQVDDQSLVIIRRVSDA